MPRLHHSLAGNSDDAVSGDCAGLQHVHVLAMLRVLKPVRPHAGSWSDGSRRLLHLNKKLQRQARSATSSQVT